MSAAVLSIFLVSVVSFDGGHSSDAADLLAGVREIAAPGVPGPLIAVGEDAFVVATAPTGAKAHEPVVVAATAGRGRVVAFGHTGYLHEPALSQADTDTLFRNAIAWVCLKKRAREARVAVRELDDVANLLDAAEWNVVAVKSLANAELLSGFDAICVGSHTLQSAEIAALREYLRRGGGLITAGLGWGWLQLNPTRTIHDHPGNQLLGEFGVYWADGTLEKTTKNGFAITDDQLPLAHAGQALAAVEQLAEGSKSLPADRIAQAVTVVTHAVRTLPSDDSLLHPKLAQLRAVHEAPIVPTEEHGVSFKQPLERLLLTLELEELRRTPTDRIQPHPAAASFPGAVPSSAKAVERTIEVDCGRPDWHSTGLYAPPGDAIRVRIPESATTLGLRVRIGAHKDELWHTPEWKRCPEITTVVSLNAEDVTTANAFGGLVYIEVPRDAPNRTAKVTIEGAVEAPYFVLGQTKLDDWRRVRAHPAPWAELESSKIIVTVPAELIRELEDPAEVMRVWDAVADASATLAARPSERDRPERYVADRQISAGYMHAGYPIMAHLDAAAAMVSAEQIKRGNWGLFHELGHNHQSRDWTFDGTGEVTCNLFTLYVFETNCGKYAESRPELFGEKRAEKIRTHMAAGTPFAKWKRDPFLALLMYMQLKEAFGWDAFVRVFAEYRNLSNADRPKSDGERRDQWMLRFSRAVDRNLGPFFQAWGVPTSAAARVEISSLPEWMPADWPGD